jgi:hypothetical protein
MDQDACEHGIRSNKLRHEYPTPLGLTGIPHFDDEILDNKIVLDVRSLDVGCLDFGSNRNNSNFTRAISFQEILAGDKCAHVECVGTLELLSQGVECIGVACPFKQKS